MNARGVYQQTNVPDGLNDEITLLYRNTPCLTTATWHTDPFPRRFLRGRSFDVPEAVKQSAEAQAIRTSVNAAEAYDSTDIGSFEHTRTMVCKPVFCPSHSIHPTLISQHPRLR